MHEEVPRGRYRNVARVTRTVARSGEVKVEATGGLPFVLSAGCEVFLTPPPLRGTYRTIVSSVRAIGDGYAVRFADVSDEAAAFELIGRTCLVSASLLAGHDATERLSSFIGREVRDERYGQVGIVVDLRLGVAQDILVVVDEDGRETLIPLVDELVRQDAGSDEIAVSLPAGLIGLNQR
jgi:16S rRNA processing protein RimM